MTDHVIIISESRKESFTRDAFTVGSLAAVIFPGWLIGSDAMQWVGSVLFAFMLLIRSIGTFAKNRKTPEEALEIVQGIISRARK